MNVAKVIEDMGGFLTDDHFVYSSGKHGEVYINKNDLAPHADVICDICMEFAKKFKDSDIDVVVGPAIGGIILAQWTAYHLSNLSNRKVLAVFAEKGPNKSFSFLRGYQKYIEGKKILIVDDLANSSGTSRNTIKSIRDLGGDIVALTVMINRNPRELNSGEIEGVPFHPLCEVDVIAYDAESCPLCEEGRPINTTVGHGKKFLES